MNKETEHSALPLDNGPMSPPVGVVDLSEDGPIIDVCPNACEVCSDGVSKYKCPGCLKKTCSLSCVKQHKFQSGCTGVRDRVAFASKNALKMAPITQYDAQLFCEGLEKQRDCCRDDQRLFKQWTPEIKRLLSAARQANVRLKIAPSGLSSRNTNTTHWNERECCITWYIRLSFIDVDSCDIPVCVDTEANDSIVLSQLISLYTHSTQCDPVIQYRLRRYIELEDCVQVKIYMKVNGLPANENKYFEFDTDKTLRENLSRTHIVEFPKLIVRLSTYCHLYPLFNPREFSRRKRGHGGGPVKTGDVNFGTGSFENGPHRTVPTPDVSNAHPSIPSYPPPLMSDLLGGNPGQDLPVWDRHTRGGGRGSSFVGPTHPHTPRYEWPRGDRRPPCNTRGHRGRGRPRRGGHCPSLGGSGVRLEDRPLMSPQPDRPALCDYEDSSADDENGPEEISTKKSTARFNPYQSNP